MERTIETWEDEGGATPRPDSAAISLSGTENQVEWALRIRRQVNDEFDRVAAAFSAVAHRQPDERRTDTEKILAILEEKRAEVMRREDAGYFIRCWQDTGDQVRQLIFRDDRYQAIRTKWPSQVRQAADKTD